MNDEAIMDAVREVAALAGCQPRHVRVIVSIGSAENDTYVELEARESCGPRTRRTTWCSVGEGGDLAAALEQAREKIPLFRSSGLYNPPRSEAP